MSRYPPIGPPPGQRPGAGVRPGDVVVDLQSVDANQGISRANSQGVLGRMNSVGGLNAASSMGLGGDGMTVAGMNNASTAGMSSNPAIFLDVPDPMAPADVADSLEPDEDFPLDELGMCKTVYEIDELLNDPQHAAAAKTKAKQKRIIERLSQKGNIVTASSVGRQVRRMQESKREAAARVGAGGIGGDFEARLKAITEATVVESLQARAALSRRLAGGFIGTPANTGEASSSSKDGHGNKNDEGTVGKKDGGKDGSHQRHHGDGGAQVVMAAPGGTSRAPRGMMGSETTWHPPLTPYRIAEMEKRLERDKKVRLPHGMEFPENDMDMCSLMKNKLVAQLAMVKESAAWDADPRFLREIDARIKCLKKTQGGKFG